VILTVENLLDFNSSYISKNRNDCPLQVSVPVRLSFSNMCTRLDFMTLISCNSTAGHVAWLGEVDNWWCSWPLANTLVCLCLCQWQTFRTIRVTINVFSVIDELHGYTTVDWAGNIVHYKRMKCYVSFAEGTLFRWGGHVFSCMCKIFIPACISIAVQKL